MPCTYTGCPHDAAFTVRIARVGDRHVCREHRDWMLSQGMDFRELGADVVIPAWRQRSLARVMDRVAS